MKLPVFKAFGATFAFVFGHIGDVIRIAWLPLAILLAAVYWIELHLLPISAQMSAIDPKSDPQAAMALMAPMFGWLGLIVLAELVLFSILMAGLLRFVVRGQRPSGFFYLRFGGDELRLLFTFLLQWLLVFVIYIIGAIVLGLGAALAVATMGAAGGIVTVVLSIALCVLLIWLMIRLSLSAPASIGLQKIGLGPSWAVTKGNAWSLFFYWLLWFVIMCVVAIVFMLIVMPDYLQNMHEMIRTAVHAHGGDPAELHRALMESQQKMMASMEKSLPIMCIAGFFVSLIIYPLLIVAGGVAYRLMTDGTDKEHAA